MAAAISAVPPRQWDRIGPVPQFAAKLNKVAGMLPGDLSVRAIYRASSEEWAGRVPLLDAPAMCSRVDAMEPLRATSRK